MGEVNKKDGRTGGRNVKKIKNQKAKIKNVETLRGDKRIKKMAELEGTTARISFCFYPAERLIEVFQNAFYLG